MSSERPVYAVPRLSARPPVGTRRDLKEVLPSLSSTSSENTSVSVESMSTNESPYALPKNGAEMRKRNAVRTTSLVCFIVSTAFLPRYSLYLKNIQKSLKQVKSTHNIHK